MDKQKVNTTSSMNSKGYSSSSHYRINPVAEKSEQVLAIKFVQWDVPPFGEPLQQQSISPACETQSWRANEP